MVSFYLVSAISDYVLYLSGEQKTKRVFIKSDRFFRSRKSSQHTSGGKSLNVYQLIVFIFPDILPNAEQVCKLIGFLIPYQYFIQVWMSSQKRFISSPQQEVDLRFWEMLM